jgi:ferredoxin
MTAVPVPVRRGPHEPPPGPPGPRGSTVPLAGIAQLVKELRRRGYRVIAPVARDGALVLDEIHDAAELPRGIGVETGPGHYRLVEREDGALFANSVGPMPWKRFLHPSHEKLLDVERGPQDELEFTVPDTDDEPPLAFVGVRPCDLRALAVLDRVFGADGARSGYSADSGYAVRRSRAFIVAVECTTPAATCFCAGVRTRQGAGSGPGVDPPGSAAYDLALTEIISGHGGHRFLARSGSCLGAEVLKAVTRTPADERTAAAARHAVERAAASMGRTLPSVDLRALMAASVDAKHWNDVAERCLACGNCTLVCPTCFCTTTEDVTDLAGDHAERWTRWGSCFDLDFSYVHGGEVRSSVRSRYRQWLTHKFGTWQDQFGTDGCVGCGRCIAWCPAGIDLTEELAALQEEWQRSFRTVEASDE